MRRFASIEALIGKSRTDFAELRSAYSASLQEKNVREDLKVKIKNIFENLRSCLDYLAREMFESFCSSSNQSCPNQLYFPIRQSDVEFNAALGRHFPGLHARCPTIAAYLRSVEPYNDPWLGQFNQLNNENKHQNLVEQTRTEAKYVEVTGRSGSVSWGPGVTFGSGVSVMGVPIDPRTQLPIPTNQVISTITVWVDFKFGSTGVSVLPFIESSIDKVDQIYRELSKHC